MKVSRNDLSKIAWITFAWVLVSLFQYIIAFSTIVDYGFDEQIDPFIPFRTSIIIGLLSGLLGGSSIVFLWEKWLRTKPYGWALRNIIINYCIIFISVSYIANAIFLSQLLDISPFSLKVLTLSAERLTYFTTLTPFIVWLVVVAFTVIALLVNDKYGPGVFRKFLMGRYFNPKREERIFMFLDLRSSTTIAEELGEQQYFAFLKDVFKFATPAILHYKGEIYQFVGDEIVISWEMDKGVKDANCIECYFKIQEALNAQEEYFTQNYQHQPEFKAGVHYGYVMAGEIGVIKREIAYSGDVLNTTARIQSKCNEFGVNLLASKQVLSLLRLSENFQPKEIGAIELRGKKERVTLCAI